MLSLICGVILLLGFAVGTAMVVYDMRKGVVWPSFILIPGYLAAIVLCILGVLGLIVFNGR